MTKDNDLAPMVAMMGAIELPCKENTQNCTQGKDHVHENEKRMHDALLKAAKNVLLWTQAEHRPPVRDPLEIGRMALVRLHALADLHAAVTRVKGGAV